MAGNIYAKWKQAERSELRAWNEYRSMHKICKRLIAFSIFMTIFAIVGWIL